MNSQSTPAAATAPPQEPNIQNVNPNVIHSTGTTTVTSASSSASTVTSPTTGASNKSQVITQNIHAKLSGGSKDDRQQQQQPESLVVSVPLSSATTVPGIQLPTTNSSNSSSNHSSTVSTIVTNQVQHQQAPAAPPAMSSSSSVPPLGSLYQHLTNNQPGAQRASPLIQQGLGRASPITPTPNLQVNDGHGTNNHTSVLQNMNAGTGGVISSAGFHGVTTSITETSSTGMLKVTYEKQAATSRIQAIQHEESSRRSRYVHFHSPHSIHCVVYVVVMCCYDFIFALSFVLTHSLIFSFVRLLSVAT